MNNTKFEPDPDYVLTNCVETIYNLEVEGTYRMDHLFGSTVFYYEASYDGDDFSVCEPDGCEREKAGTERHSCGD